MFDQSHLKKKIIMRQGEVPTERSYQENIHVKYLLKDKSFQKVGQTPRSRSQGQNCWYPWKGILK